MKLSRMKLCLSLVVLGPDEAVPQPGGVEPDEAVPEPGGVGPDEAVPEPGGAGPSVGRQQAEQFVAGVVGIFCVAALLERSRPARMCTERYRLHYKICCNSLNSEPIFM